MSGEVDLDGKTIEDVAAAWIADTRGGLESLGAVGGRSEATRPRPRVLSGSPRRSEIGRRSSRLRLEFRDEGCHPAGRRGCHGATLPSRQEADSRQARLPQRLEAVRPRGPRSSFAARDGRANAGRARRGEPGRRGARRRPRGPRGRDLRHHGPVGLGQVDAGALPVAADRADRRRDPVQRPRTCWPPARRRADRAAPPPDGHGVPEFRAAAASHRAGQRRLSAGRPGRRRARPARARAQEDDRAGRPGAAARAFLSARTVRRPAAARRHRPRARRRSRSSGSSTSRSRRSTR